MKLYVKQKFFSLIDRFSILDENHEDVFVVEGEWFSLKRKLTVFNTKFEPVAHVSRQLFRLMPHIDVSLVDQENFTIVKRFTLFNQRYIIEGDSWEVEGDFFAHEYQILSGNDLIATISKAWLTFSDYYEINIINARDVLKVLSVVLAIDIAMVQQNQS